MNQQAIRLIISKHTSRSSERSRALRTVARGGLLLAAACVGLSIAGTETARAATSTASIAVTATVLSYCSVAAAPLTFGNYSSTAASLANTTLSVLCTNGTPYNIGLDQGAGSGATTTTRTLTVPSSATLNYALYTSNALTTTWGNVIGTSTVPGTGNGLGQSLTVYGKIASGQYTAPGAYTDSVTVTLTY